MMYTSTALAEILGVHLSTIFSWEDQGIIPEPQRDIRGRRLYSQDEVDKLKQIAAVRKASYLKQRTGQ